MPSHWNSGHLEPQCGAFWRQASCTRGAEGTVLPKGASESPGPGGKRRCDQRRRTSHMATGAFLGVLGLLMLLFFSREKCKIFIYSDLSVFSFTTWVLSPFLCRESFLLNFCQQFYILFFTFSLLICVKSVSIQFEARI